MVHGGPYPEVTVAILPSSLRTSHSFALVYSTYPPVLVWGTDSICLTLEAFLGSMLVQIGAAEALPLCGAWAYDSRIYLTITLTIQTTIQ